MPLLAIICDHCHEPITYPERPVLVGGGPEWSREAVHPSCVAEWEDGRDA